MPANEVIQSLVQRIYGETQVDSIVDRLQALMRRYAQPLFSEKDVVLITYGDTLRSGNEPPLRTLQRFTSERLKGVISAVHILPFYPYSSDDGFSVQDFYAVNPELGDWNDVERLGKDFDLMFDAVFNHMSAQSEWFRAFLDDEAPYDRFFRIEDPDTDLSSVTRPRSLPLLTPFTKTNGQTVHVWTTFSADQVDLDFRSPEVLLRMIDVLLFYISKGAKIIRLDAIAFLWKVVGTSSIHLDETHAVIQLMRAVLDQVAPGVILITETNVPHTENISYFGDGYNEAQMVYNFTLPPLLFYTMRSGDTAKFREWVNTLQTPSLQTTFFNFTASHDGVGVRPVEGILNESEIKGLIAHVESTGGRVNYRRNSDGSDTPYELNITYVDAVTDQSQPEEVQVKQFLLAQAVQLALAGVPAIYIHSLIGSRNDLEGMARTGHNRSINRAKLSAAEVEAMLNDPSNFRGRVFHQYVRLIKIRRGQSAFHPNASQHALDLANNAVFALRRASDAQTILALYNFSGQAQTVALSAAHFSAQASVQTRDLITGQTAEIGTETAYTLDPYQAAWLSVTE